MTLKDALRKVVTVRGGEDDSDGKGGNESGGCGDGDGCGRK